MGWKQQFLWLRFAVTHSKQCCERLLRNVFKWYQRGLCVLLSLSVCERERGKYIFGFMQIHLVRSLGIMWKLKMEKRNVTGAQRWMNTLHGKYPHVQTEVHVTHTQYLNIYTQAFKYTSCFRGMLYCWCLIWNKVRRLHKKTVIISCYLCVRNLCLY